MAASVFGVTDGDFGRSCGGGCYSRVINLALHQHSGRGVAGLAGIVHAMHHTTRNRVFVGIGKDDICPLAAQFQTDTFYRVGSVFLDRGSGTGGTGEGNHIDILVAGKLRPDTQTVAIHQVENASREPGLINHFGKQHT